MPEDWRPPYLLVSYCITSSKVNAFDLLSCNLLCRQGPMALNSTTFHPSLQQSVDLGGLGLQKPSYSATSEALAVVHQGRYVSSQRLQPMASEINEMLRVLGKGLPTVTNWLDGNWLLTLFGLSVHGVQFHVFQSWTREVTGRSSIILEKEKDMHHSPVVLPPSPRQEVIESGAWGVSRILGATLPSEENWLDDHWLHALFVFSSRGVQFSAFQAWSRHVALVTPIIPGRKRGLVEVLPDLLVNTEMLKFKSRELCEFVGELNRKRFYVKEYLEDIKAHLEKHKLVYWKRLDVKITIEVTMALALSKDVPDRMRNFYISKPSVHRCECEVVEEGSNCRAWVMRCGNSIGVYRTKKGARMIAIIKEHIDPSFDLEGDSLPPSLYLNDQNRKRMRTMDMAVSSEDTEIVAPKKPRKKRITEDEVMTK